MCVCNCAKTRNIFPAAFVHFKLETLLLSVGRICLPLTQTNPPLGAKSDKTAAAVIRGGTITLGHQDRAEEA